MNRREITGLILAGGQGRRMGGVDKGIQPFRGRPMVEWVVDRLSPQVGPLLINCNQNLDVYARFGHPLVSDSIAGFAGPLAGLQAGLSEATTPLLATCPCDSPFLPADLVARLHAGLRESGARLAVARTGAQAHPVFLLCTRDLLDGLNRYLREGGRKIDAWYDSIGAVEVGFDDEAEAFVNINTVAQLSAMDGRGRTA